MRTALADGRLTRSLLHPHDAVDLALLGRALQADWVLQPGKQTTLLSVQNLQTAALNLSEKPEEDTQALREAVTAMARQEPRAGQLESLALRCLSRGQADLALEILFQAQTLEPDRVSTQAMLVDAYRVKGDFVEARRFLRMTMKMHPDELRLFRAGGELELAQDHPREALEFFIKAAGNGNATPALHRLVGETLQALGRYRMAEEEYKLAEGEPGVASRLARLLARREEWSQASESAARALEENPGDWEMRFMLAKGQSSSGQYAQAALDRAKALTLAADTDSAPTPVSFTLLQSAIRDQLADTINAVRQMQLKDQDATLLYTAAQESVIAADRLRTALQGRPDGQSDRVSGKQRMLALTLWSQGAFDLLKGLEAKDQDEIAGSGETLRDALQALDDAKTKGSRLTSSR